MIDIKPCWVWLDPTPPKKRSDRDKLAKAIEVYYSRFNEDPSFLYVSETFDVSAAHEGLTIEIKKHIKAGYFWFELPKDYKRSWR